MTITRPAPFAPYAARVAFARKALAERRAAEVAALTAYSKAHALAIKNKTPRPHIDDYISRK